PNIVNDVSPASTPVASGRYPYRRLSKPFPGDNVKAQKLFAQGAQAQKTNRLPEAMAAYRAAVQADPAYYEAWYNLAVSATDSGNLNSALTSYEQALAIWPDSPDARYNFALILRKSNFFQDAANEFEKLLARFPNEGRAHLALGNMYAEQFQDSAKARQHYAKVLEIDPQNSQAPVIRYWIAAHPL